MTAWSSEFCGLQDLVGVSSGDIEERQRQLDDIDVEMVRWSSELASARRSSSDDGVVPSRWISSVGVDGGCRRSGGSDGAGRWRSARDGALRSGSARPVGAASYIASLGYLTMKGKPLSSTVELL